MYHEESAVTLQQGNVMHIYGIQDEICRYAPNKEVIYPPNLCYG